MKTLRYVAPLLLVAAVAATGLPGEGGEVMAARSVVSGPFTMKLAPPDELSKLCPEGALVFARLNNPKGVDAELAALKNAILPGDEKDASVLVNMGRMVGNPDLTGMDTGRPIGVALFMGEMGPMPVLILPLSDQAAFAEKVGAESGVSYVGTHAVWSMDPDLAAAVKPAEEPTALARSLMHGDLAVSVDMKAAQPLFAPLFAQIDQFVAMIRQMAPGPAADMYASMATMMKQTLTDAEQAGFAVDLRDGRIEMAFRYSAKEGTATAKLIAAEKITAKSLLGFVDRAGFMAVEMRTGGESIWNSFGPIYEGMLKDAGPEALAMMKKSFSLLNGMAFGMSLKGGLSAVSVSGVTDEAEYSKILDEMPKLMTSIMDAYKKMMPPEMDFPMDMDLTVGEPFEYAGVRVRPYSMKIVLRETDEMPPEAIAAMREMMAALIGGESIDFQYAILSGHVLGTVGPKATDDMKALIDRVKAGGAGALTPALAEATAGFPEPTTSLFTMDFAEILRIVADLKALPMEDAVRAKLRAAPDGLSISGFTTNDGKATGLGMRIDLMKIIRYAKTFE